MKRLAVLAALALSGCVHTRYVQTSCLSAEQYDKLAAAMPPKVANRLTGKADEDVRTIAASGIRLRGYAEGLLEVLHGCIEIVNHSRQ